MYFKIKDNVDIDKHRLIEYFFKDWVDETCNREVDYKMEKDAGSNIFRADFDQTQDAVALTLKGVPADLRAYLEIV